MSDYKYQKEAIDNVSLHDCRCNHIEYKDEVLSFFFPKGIYLKRDKEYELVSNAKIDYQIRYDEVTVYVYKSIFYKTLRLDYSNRFIKDINEGKYELEFLYEYKGYESYLYQCNIWFDKKPYHYDCQIELGTKQQKLFWND